MSVFGWSLPPGVSMNDIDAQFGGEDDCERCGFPVVECQCPECPICRSLGCIDHLTQEEAAKLIRQLRAEIWANAEYVELGKQAKRSSIRQEYRLGDWT